MLVLNLPFKALMFLTLMRPSLVLFLVLWLKLRSEERFSRNAETDLVCRLLLEKKKRQAVNWLRSVYCGPLYLLVQLVQRDRTLWLHSEVEYERFRGGRDADYHFAPGYSSLFPGWLHVLARRVFRLQT